MKQNRNIFQKIIVFLFFCILLSHVEYFKVNSVAVTN